MKPISKKIIFPILCILVLCLGIYSGIKWRDYKNSKTVVFRISTPQSSMNYDLVTAANYLQYQFEKLGYTVLPWRYPGEFYHQKGDNAAINVFIRNTEFFYDTRMNKNALNIYYQHRFLTMYAEELQNYDYYLSSQKNLQKALPHYQNISYVSGGAVPHKRLLPQYEYDILYITEYPAPQQQEFSNKNYHIKNYTDLDFANLPIEEREKLLSQARLVIYEVATSPLDDNDYIPYAVYDIISYGRPLLTNSPTKLSKIAGKVHYYHNLNDIELKISQILAEDDELRELKAETARKEIIELSKKDTLNLSLKN